MILAIFTQYSAGDDDDLEIKFFYPSNYCLLLGGGFSQLTTGLCCGVSTNRVDSFRNACKICKQFCEQLFGGWFLCYTMSSGLRSCVALSWGAGGGSGGICGILKWILNLNLCLILLNGLMLLQPDRGGHIGKLCICWWLQIKSFFVWGSFSWNK